MMTLYCYEELPYKVQQEVDKKVKQTTAYKKYVDSFYKERLTEILGQNFTSSEVTANIIKVYSLKDLAYGGAYNDWEEVFNYITYNMDNKKVEVIVTVDETIDYNYLSNFIKSITVVFSEYMKKIINASISIEPDMGQFLTDKSFTEDGKEVEISFK